jgi:PEP-CTERM putative exosortase interaction domain
MLVTATAIAASCMWTNPGAAPYRASVVESTTAAVANYDIPQYAKAELVAKVRRLEPDALVVITRDSLYSSQGKAYNLRDMHWGSGVCYGSVNRSKWREDQAESAFVYCSDNHCIAIPIICGNVSRIDFVPNKPKEVPFRWWEGDLLSKPVYNVPEPSTAALVAVGLLIAVISRRNKCNKLK